MRQILLIIFTGLNCGLFAQNLVPNGDFEDKKHCPSSYRFTTIENVEVWTNPPYLDSKNNEYNHTPDFYHTCAPGEHGVPENKMGIQEAHSGKGYAGLIMMSNERFGRVEFIQAKLSSPLKANTTYLLEYYVSLADGSVFTIDLIGALLHKETQFKSIQNESILLAKNEGTEKKFFREEDGWVKVSACVKAKGGEQYLTIGNFQSRRYYRTQKAGHSYDGNKRKFAYFYVDDVSLKVCYRGSCDCPRPVERKKISALEGAKSDLKYKRQAKFELEDIQFRKDEHEILSSSYSELNKLADFLKEHEKVKARVLGYTDDTGNPEYNEELSEKRALAVAKYLIEKGINERRISYHGYGEKFPVATNKTEAGRKRNRRVAVVLRR